MNRTLAPLPARRMPTLPPIDSASRSSIRILVVDDERTLRESCHSVLQAEGYNVVVAGRGNEARDTLKRRPFDIALVDWFMGEVPGSELVHTALTTNPGTIVIIMTGNPSVASSLEALQAGAWDYLPNPFSGTQLQILIGRAAHAILVARESRVLEEQRAQHPGDGDRIAVLGDSPLFKKAIALARKVAATDASVFLTGESGAGKELFAQFIHDNSRRSSRSLVAVNCAALPEPLLESEMFGHCKGAFTGAVRDKPGLLETANGGTLFLDELIEMPKSIQAKLLRVIQDGVVRRVGSETTDAPHHTVLDDPQQLRLDRLRHLDQLVEEQRAPVGGLEQAGLVAHRAREGALAVAEHLGLEQRLGERGAVHGDERATGAPAVVVDELGEH